MQFVSIIKIHTKSLTLKMRKYNVKVFKVIFKFYTFVEVFFSETKSIQCFILQMIKHKDLFTPPRYNEHNVYIKRLLVQLAFSTSI